MEKLFQTLSPQQQAALQAGDRELLEELLKAIFPAAHRWLHRTLADKSSVEDALQETMIELARALPSFRGEARLSTFAHRITMRVAYRYFSRAKYARLEEVDWESQPSRRQMEGQLIARSELALVHRLLDRLSEGRRVAFLLCEVEGLSPAEAGRMVGIPSLVMRSRLCRARADVKRLLTENAQGALTVVEVA